MMEVKMIPATTMRDKRVSILYLKAISILKRLKAVIPHAERWLLGEQFDEQVVAPPPESIEVLETITGQASEESAETHK